MRVPDGAYKADRHGAVLRLRKLPICDTFFFGNCQGVASETSCTVRWKATSKPKRRGLGKSVPPTDPGAFKGELADASCTAVVRGSQTGYSYRSLGKLDAKGFFAEFGWEANGSML